MEERKKDNLANGDDYSVVDIDEAIKNDDIIEIDDSGETEYDEEYMTNVSNNLVSEVDKVLNDISEEDHEEVKEETKPLEEVKEELPAEEPKEEVPVREEPEPVREETKVVEEKPIVEENPAESIFDDNERMEVRNEETVEKSFEELRREQENNRMEKRNARFEKSSHVDTSVPNNGKYVSYESRVIKFSVIFVALFLVGFFLMYKSFTFNQEKYINYTETTNLDYKVYLKENKFYEEEYLEKGMLYVASLIDKIDIDFLYNFNISEQVDLDFKYNITGVLSITDNDGKNVYLTKDYKLLDDKTFSLKGEQDHTIKENIVIDYGAYNKLANSFKSTYGLDTASKLTVYLNVDKNSVNQDVKDVEKANNMLIEIPLSQRSVSISMDYKDINRNSSLVKKSSVTVNNVAFIIIGGLVIIASFYGLYKLLKLLGLLTPKKSAYDKYVAKMMRQYDRLIVVHYTCPDLSKYNVVKIKEFNELLDMRDNLKVPIMYYNVTDHQKSYFYILNNNDLYLLVLKSVDFDK